MDQKQLSNAKVYNVKYQSHLIHARLYHIKIISYTRDYITRDTAEENFFPPASKMAVGASNGRMVV